MLMRRKDASWWVRESWLKKSEKGNILLLLTLPTSSFACIFSASAIILAYPCAGEAHLQIPLGHQIYPHGDSNTGSRPTALAPVTNILTSSLPMFASLVESLQVVCPLEVHPPYIRRTGCITLPRRAKSARALERPHLHSPLAVPMLISLHLVRAPPLLRGDVAPAALVTLVSIDRTSCGLAQSRTSGKQSATKDKISAEPRLKSAKREHPFTRRPSGHFALPRTPWCARHRWWHARTTKSSHRASMTDQHAPAPHRTQPVPQTPHTPVVADHLSPLPSPAPGPSRMLKPAVSSAGVIPMPPLHPQQWRSRTCPGTVPMPLGSSSPSSLPVDFPCTGRPCARMRMDSGVTDAFGLVEPVLQVELEMAEIKQAIEPPDAVTPALEQPVAPPARVLFVALAAQLALWLGLGLVVVEVARSVAVCGGALAHPVAAAEHRRGVALIARARAATACKLVDGTAQGGLEYAYHSHHLPDAAGTWCHGPA
ncbi:hypothetical protein B0H10DRAFT_1948622 [Mycena sp. CBHHK59/15]|nr:hypothetical protein B0H10DRAFT_1948622 [Mycena sp. CBHHK59/15]